MIGLVSLMRPLRLRSRSATVNPTESRTRALVFRAWVTVTFPLARVASVAMRVTGSPPRRRAADARVGAGTIVKGASRMPQPRS